jgi:carboxypeptidase PM20D1
MHQLLQTNYPRLHATLTREIIHRSALLYRWTGRESCPPLLLLAHQDVVPVEPGTESDWQHPAFSGIVAQEMIWGRGAIDDKAALIGMMEAIEHLLADAFEPQCDIWLAFGHDEEVGGAQGAVALAARLQQLGVKPAFVLDEGGAITQGTVPNLKPPLATIGVAEKG